jgi:hypothetical protein
MFSCNKAFTAISGPMLAGSPMVMAIIDLFIFSFWLPAFVF